MFRSIFSPRTNTPIPIMQPRELHKKVKAGDDLLIVDVRTAEEYAHDGHIAGSRLLPLFALNARHGELPTDKTIVCVCRSGARSQVACEQLRRLGYSELYNLQGGMIAWRGSGLPVRRG